MQPLRLKVNILQTVYHPTTKNDVAAGEIHGNGPSLGVFHGNLPAGLLAVYMALRPKVGRGALARAAPANAMSMVKAHTTI